MLLSAPTVSAIAGKSPPVAVRRETQSHSADKDNNDSDSKSQNDDVTENRRGKESEGSELMEKRESESSGDKDEDDDSDGVSGAAGRGGGSGDSAHVARPRELTSLPRDLDAAYSVLDPDSRLRPVVITPGGPWVRASYASLLSRTPVETALDAASQASSRAAAFDLIDALSRSGALPLRHAAMHVLVGAAHGFDASLVDTLTRDNINPIEKVERSLLIVASTLAGKPPAELVRGGHAARIAAHSPTLFAASEGAAASLTAPSTHVA